MAHLWGFGSLLKMTICHVSGWHTFAILSGESIKGWQSVAAPLASDFACPTICNCLFHIFGLSMLSNVVKETAVTMALDMGKKNTASHELAKHRNQICKTRHSEKFASLKLVQLAPRSFCHAVDGIREQPRKSNFSRGDLRKTSSRSAAPSAPLVKSPKHLECLKEDGGDIQPCGRMAYRKRYVYAMQAPILQKPRLCGR